MNVVIVLDCKIMKNLKRKDEEKYKKNKIIVEETDEQKKVLH